jgi:hypothetical protein
MDRFILPSADFGAFLDWEEPRRGAIDTSAGCLPQPDRKIIRLPGRRCIAGQGAQQLLRRDSAKT